MLSTPKETAARQPSILKLWSQHRSENINRAASAPSSAPASVSISKGRANEAALNIRAQRQMRELEIAERIGALTPTREVRAAAAEAMSALRNAFALSLNNSAAALAHAFNIEPRLVRPHLKAFEKNGLEAFARALCRRRARARSMLDVPMDVERFTADLPGVADGRRTLFDELARLAKPEAELTVSEFADQYRVVSPESGSPFPGPWRTDRVPYLREPMDCLHPDHPSRRVTLKASAQTGKSEVGVNWFCLHRRSSAGAAC